MLPRLSFDASGLGKRCLIHGDYALLTDFATNNVLETVPLVRVSSNLLIQSDEVEVVSFLLDKKNKTLRHTIFANQLVSKGVVTVPVFKQLEQGYRRKHGFIYQTDLRLSDLFHQFIFVFRRGSFV